MEETKERVLVAGATGYLGQFVAREFARRGHHVRALARSPRKLDHMKDQIGEIVEGQVTQPDSIQNVCDGIEVVFSSIGITKQKDRLTFRDVDYRANVNLLQVARHAGVRKFIYVSVFDGPNLLHLDIVKAHEDFVDVLRTSGIDYAVVRPTGYFSDMGEFVKAARKGRVYLIGRGRNRVNPIHGADLAERCVDTLEGEHREIDVGGPEVLTYREIAELAFKSLGKRSRITSIPAWAMRPAVATAKAFHEHEGELLAFFSAAMTSDMVAPKTGTHSLEDYFFELACKGRR